MECKNEMQAADERRLARAVICNIDETTPGGFRPKTRASIAIPAAWLLSASVVLWILAVVQP